MSNLARLGGTIGLLAGAISIFIGSFFASGPVLLTFVRIFHIQSVSRVLLLGTAIRVTVLILVLIALLCFVTLSGRRRSETLRRLEWRFTAAAGVLAGVVLAKLLLAPTGVSETTSSTVDAHGHTHTVTHSTATYFLQPDVGGISLGIAVAVASLVVIAVVLSLAYRDWRSGQSGNVPLLWIIAVAFEGAAIVTGFSIGFWFLAVPPLLMLGALAGSLAGTRGSGSDPGLSTTPA